MAERTVAAVALGEQAAVTALTLLFTKMALPSLRAFA
jgi:hypothetical protein